MDSIKEKPPSTKIPPLVKRLGWVSFFTDAASEMLYPLIPIFLTVTLGAPATVVGLVEGFADATATGLKAVAGVVADRFRRYRLMVILGYGVAALAKPLLAFAPSWGFVAGLRVTDRVGKAFRGVPRDVMIDDATDPANRGRAFGYHRAMDTAGAVVGPLIAIAALLVLGQQNLKPVFLIALVPGIGAMAMLRRLPPDPDKGTGKRWEKGKLPWRGRFGLFVLVTIVFGVGNSSDAFLILRAKNLGLSTIQVLLAYTLYNVIYSLTAFPAGIRADRKSRIGVFAGGLVVFAVVYAGFGMIDTAIAVWPLIAIYGLYMSFTDGIGRAIVLDLVPPDVRGKALGVTQAITGGSVLIAGVTAGLLWDRVSPSAPFILGAITAGASAIMLLVLLPASKRENANLI